MITERACFTEQPEELLYMPLPNGGADVWLRKNPTEVTVNNEDGEPTTHWEVDEAYIRFNNDPPSKKDIAADFEGWFDTATEWQPTVPQPPEGSTGVDGGGGGTATIPPELIGRVEALEEQSGELQSKNSEVLNLLNTILGVNENE